MNLCTWTQGLRKCLPVLIAALAILAPSVLDAQSMMRVVHVLPGGTPLDAKIANTSVATNLAFRDATSNVAVSANVLTEFFEAGTSNRLTFKTYPTTTDKSYTIYMVGIPPKSLEAPVVVERLSSLTFFNGVGKLGVVNMAPDAGDLDVVITDAKGQKKSFDGMSYKAARPYQDTNPGTFTVEVAQKGGAVFYRATGNLPSEKAATIVITGRLAVANEFKINMVTDNDDSEQRPIATLTPSLENKQAKYRVAQLVPDIAPVDVYVDNVRPAFATGLGWRNATELLVTGDGNRTIKLISPGVKPDSTFQAVSGSLSADTIYTFLAIGTKATTTETFWLTHHVNLTPSAGMAKFRLFHASIDAGQLDIKVTKSDGNSFERKNVEYKSLTESFDMPSGAVRIDVGPAGQPPTISVAGMVAAGKIVTFAVTGRKSEAGEMGVNVIDESADAAQAPITLLEPVQEPVGEAKVRVVHLAAGFGAVDIFLDDETTPRVSGLAYREATVLSTFDAGDHQVKVGLAGTGTTVTTLPVTLNADTAYTAYAYSLTGTPLLTRAYDLAPTAGKALVRLLHVSSDAGALDFTLAASDGGKITQNSFAAGESTEYAEIAPGKITVDLAAEGGAVFYRGTGNVAAGDIITLAVSGVKTTSQLAVNVVDDKNEAEQKPLAALTETTGVDDESNLTATLSVAPNPTRSILGVRFNLAKAESVRIALYDAIGNAVRSLDVPADGSGSHAVSVSTDGMAAGLYNLVMTGGNGAVIGVRPVMVVR